LASPDITLNEAWQNIYTVSGITPGSAVYVQNKSLRLMFIQSSSTPPSADDRSGFQLGIGASIGLPSGDNNLWVWGHGAVLIQTDSVVTPWPSSSGGSSGGSTPVTIADRIRVEPLGTLSTPRQIDVSNGGGYVTLTSTCVRFTVIARGGDIRIAMGTTTPSDTTAALLLAGTERDYVCPTNSSIAAIKASHETASTTVLEIIEIAELS